tara:strand:+ start:688 stop:972 length:285 start_codon:yes stop_codon:yes gene_type:complete
MNTLNAILKINPNAKALVTRKSGELKDSIEWLDDTAEISETDINAKIAEMETAEANEETAKATAKASGNTKLLDLGLTQSEATALTGYAPPAEV